VVDDPEVQLLVLGSLEDGEQRLWIQAVAERAPELVHAAQHLDGHAVARQYDAATLVRRVLASVGDDLVEELS
jgi:hypothetical protein